MKPITVKIGRRRCGGGYEIGPSRARFDSECGFPMSYFITGFCDKKFERVTEFKLKLGESCLVQFHVKRVKK